MTEPMSMIRELPHALRDGDRFAQRLDGRRPAVFLDYDGVLTPIVDHPEDALISDRMRDTVRALAMRCQVCVVTGRDRLDVQRLMGVDDLVVAGSHGFDIWSPAAGEIHHDAVSGFEDVIGEVTDRLRTETGSIPGVVIEPKKASVAVHYRLVDPDRRQRIATVVETLLAEHPDRLKMTPGKMVYELQPQIDWHKGKAVLHLLRDLGLDSPDVVAIYLGDDITDEDAFRALAGRGGAGIFVGTADDPEVGDRNTSADFILSSPEEVAQLLSTLAVAEGRPPDDRESESDCVLVYDHFDPGDEGLREALTSTGNGYFCTRGAAEWEDTGRRPLPGHLRPRRLQPGDDDPRRPPGAQRGPGQPAELARPQAAHRGRGGDHGSPTSKCSPTGTPTTSAPRRWPRRLRFRDRKGRETTLRSRRFVIMAHSHQAGDRVDADPRELVGSSRDRLRHRRPRRQPDGRPLPRPRGPPPRPGHPADVRPGDHRAEGAHPAVEPLHLRGRPHPGLQLGRSSRLAVGAHVAPDERLHPAGARPRRAHEGESVRVEKMVSFFTSHDNAITETLTAAGRHVVRYPDFAEAFAEHASAWTELWDVCDVELPAGAPGAAAAAVPHRARPAGLLAAHRPPRRGRPGPRAQRRGLPRARVLGRALHLPVPQLPAARGHPRPADVPLPPARRGPARPPARRASGRHVPVAVRQRRHRGDAGRPPQPALGQWDPDHSPQPAPRQRRDLLQRLAVLPGHRRPGVPARLRRRADARDRALLGLDRPLQPATATATRSTA